MHVIDVDTCVRNAPEAQGVRNALKTTPIVFMVIGKGKETKSKLSHPSFDLDQTKFGPRDLSESLDRVTSLEEENQNLLSALRTVTSDPEFPAEKFGDVMKTLAKVNNFLT